jgi:small multidrug resistance pump
VKIPAEFSLARRDPELLKQANYRNWMTVCLRIAGFYNLLWGAFVILWPSAIFSWSDLAQPNYPELWQCIGMIVGVYGLGYWVAAYNPLRHWPIVWVGLLGKICGPIGFIWAIAHDRFNWQFGSVIVFNDLIWWIPFAMILRRAWAR